MKQLLKEIGHNPLLWMLAVVPVVFAVERFQPEAHTLLFVLSVLGIIPLAALLSLATESVAARAGDAVGGLLNATLGNLTELVVSAAALHAGQYMLVKASVAGAIVTNTLFVLGSSFLLGGLQDHTGVQPGKRPFSGRSALPGHSSSSHSLGRCGSRLGSGSSNHPKTKRGTQCCFLAAYGLGMLFSLKTHRELFAGVEHGDSGETLLPIGVALGTLAFVTLLVALVSEVFVDSVQQAALSFGMTPAFVGFVVVSLVGGAAEMGSAFSGARKNRLDLSVGIALGSASQIALFVVPVLVLLSYVLCPSPMDLLFGQEL